MTSCRIAKRYARAFFELAADRNVLENTSREIIDLRNCISSSEDLKIFVRNPVLTKEQQAKVISAIFEGRLNIFVINFLFFLVEKNRLNLLDEICSIFNDLYLLKNRIAVVRITSAFTVDHGQIEKIEQQLSNIYKMNIQSEVIVNKDLIGGMKLKIDDVVYDCSFQTHLNNFHQRICHNE